MFARSATQRFVFCTTGSGELEQLPQHLEWRVAFTEPSHFELELGLERELELELMQAHVPYGTKQFLRVEAGARALRSW